MQTNSVQTRGKCLLLCVDCSVYHAAVQDADEKLRALKIDFLKSCQAFVGCPKKELEQVAKSLVFKSFSAGSCLLKQGRPKNPYTKTYSFLD